MSHQPAPAPSPFLALARELRNQIYADAIISCVAAENALGDQRATDRPQLGTVTHNANPPPSKGLCIRLRLRHDEPKAARAARKLLRAASPGALLLVSRQVSAEFSDELFRHAKLVGQYTVHTHHPDHHQPGRRSFDCDIAALVGTAPAALPLHRLRRWEVQVDALDPRAGRPATYMRCVDAALRQLPGVEELTMRLTIADWRVYGARGIRDVCGGGGAHKRVLRPAELMAARVVHRRGVRVFRKVCTLGFGGGEEASRARQVFPLMERVERWDGEAGAMRVVEDVKNDVHYCRFYTMSKANGYYWVEKQYQPYDKFGPAGSYQATMDAVMHGYSLWVVKGKPGWNETEEHRKITKELGPCATRQMVKRLGAQLGY